MEIAELRNILGEKLTPVLERIEKNDKASEAFHTRLAEIEKRWVARVDSIISGGSDELKKRPFNVCNLLRAQMYRKDGRAYNGAKHEFALLKAYNEKRNVSDNQASLIKAGIEAGTIEKDMSTTVGNLGGDLVPTELLASEFIELLDAQAIVRQLGARSLDNLTGSPVELPRIDTGATAFYVAEGQAGTEADLNVGTVKLAPRELMALVRSSRQLLSQSIVSVDQMIRDSIVSKFALKEDLSAFTGAGGNTPIGLFSDAAVPAVTLATVTQALLKDFVNTVRAANALQGRLGWAMSPGGWNIIDKLVDLNGRPLLQMDPSNATLGRLLGYPVFTTTQLATAQVVFGNWDDLVLARWGQMEFAITSEGEGTFVNNQSLIRGLMLHDLSTRHPTSFVKATDLAA